MTNTVQYTNPVQYDAAGEVRNDGENQYLYDTEGPHQNCFLLKLYQYPSFAQTAARRMGHPASICTCDESSSGVG
jgi:hypothetical protein